MDAVDAATAGVPRLYALNSVPGKPTYPYGTYAAAFGGGGAYTLEAAHGVRHGLVSVQTFGKTAASALELMEKVVDALLDVRLAVSGWDCTPLRAALDNPAINRDPDDNGVVTATLPFTTAATKEA
jgi:hypothetical protein